MPSKCCVPNCRFYKKAIPTGKPAFGLPSHVGNKERWLEILGIQNISYTSRVCWLHFKNDDYFKFLKTHRLKNNVFPVPIEAEGNISSIEPIDAEECTIDGEASTSSGRPKEGQTSISSVCSVKSTKALASSSCVKPAESVRIESSARRKTIRKKKICSPVKVIHLRSRFVIENFINNDKKINYFTGIPKFAILIAIFRYALKSEKGSPGAVHHTGTTGKWKKRHQLTPLNEFFLTLMKVRHAFETETLAVMFVISPSTVSKIFSSWINLLYVTLAAINVFPHRDAIIENSPGSFKRKYPNTIGSIDCTEIMIQAPSSLVRQSQCFSHYKGSTTLKALIMIEPCGGVMFVSSLFTGSISDKKIVEGSGFVDLLKLKVHKGSLKQGDIILADKGFEIQNIMDEIGININIPTFRLAGIQFQENEVEYVRKIAHERIHVERAIRRIKTYKILSNKIPITLLGNMNQIFTVCALLTNFKMPLRKKQ